MTQAQINPCLPPPDPCRSPVVPLFHPGLSFRAVPLCEGPYAECPQPGYARMRITSSGSIDRADWIRGWIMAQLTTRGEVSCEEHPLKMRAGGWWADAFRIPAGFKTGSKLWALQWSLVTNEALIMAKQYATTALNPLMQWGIASRINIDASYVSCKVMRLAIDVTGPGVASTATVQGMAMPDSAWLWQEYKATALG